MNSKQIKMTLYDYATSDEENLWLLDQFDLDKNFPYTSKDFGKASNKRVYFRFPCGHSVPQRIADKTLKQSKKCPYCMNRGSVGKSLAKEYPTYADMFMAEKNGVSAEQVSAHNGQSYWWKCNVCGHEFTGTVAGMVSGHRVCECCSNNKISFTEYCIYFYLKQIDDKCELSKKIEGYRFDIYLPKYNLVIEFDGYPWHVSEEAQKNDAIKDNICEKLHVHILRIRDSRLIENKNLTATIWNVDYDIELNFLSALPQKIGECVKEEILPLDVNVKRDFRKITDFRSADKRKKSLLVHMPELSNFIDEDNVRNGNLEFVTYASHRILFWLRDPEYPLLKWSMTVHNLFQKQNPYTQWIKMCRKMLVRYPELERQIYNYGNDIRGNSMFRLKCSCGKEFEKTYTALMYQKMPRFCAECICKYRIKKQEDNSVNCKSGSEKWSVK